MHEQAIIDLAKSDPARLTSLISSGALKGVEWTWAGEHLGLYGKSMDVVPVLLDLLEHHSPLAREGALLGLHMHHDDSRVLDAVRRHIDPALEPSDAIRQMAIDMVMAIELGNLDNTCT